MVKYLSRVLATFKHDERGSFSFFMVTMFTTMILIGGAGVDLIRYEAVRSSIQYNLDRSVLAAASLRQTKPPLVVINDYMSKVDTLTSFNVQLDAANTKVTLTGRKVSATATAKISTYFLRIAGINTLEVSAASKASEIIPNVEISMVLDVSGSMSGTKISSLQKAAKEFVNTMIIPGDDSLTTISLVPYSTNVSLPQNMWDEYKNIDLVTDKTRCIVFDDADYDVAAINESDYLKQLSYYSERGGLSVALNYWQCEQAAYAEIMPFSTSIVDLENKIDDFIARGSTGVHLGTKWGVALLDPSSNFIAQAVGSPEAAMVPEAYTEPGVQKVLVVMTDGENQNFYDMADANRKGLSDMYYVTEVTETVTSEPICDRSWKVRYFVAYGWYASTCRWEDTVETTDNSGHYIYKPSNNTYYKVYRNAYYYYGTDIGDTLPGDPNALSGENGYQENYSWPKVWETISTRAYSYTIHGNGTGYHYRKSTSLEVDDLTKAACTAAKNKGVVVYTIAFEAPSRSRDLLKACATSTGHYYKAKSSNISKIFAAIAQSVQKLKLTQ